MIGFRKTVEERLYLRILIEIDLPDHRKHLIGMRTVYKRNAFADLLGNR